VDALWAKLGVGGGATQLELPLLVRLRALATRGTTFMPCISRDSRHKRRETGGKRKAYRKKRKYELGRPMANTKMCAPDQKRVRRVRARGGHIKFRALRLDSGNFAWGSESATKKTRILQVVYNASNNELVRTNTLVKNAIIQIDATPFRQFYEQHYGVALGGKKVVKKEGEAAAKKSDHVLRKLSSRNKTRTLDPALEEQFATGRLLACVASRPGQSGRADGYVLEGAELQFYQKKIQKKR